MEKNLNQGGRSAPMDDSVLDQVSGGTSLYEEADGTERDSWLASLVSRVIKNPGEEKKKTQTPQTNTAPLSTIIIGDYSSTEKM